MRLYDLKIFGTRNAIMGGLSLSGKGLMWSDIIAVRNARNVRTAGTARGMVANLIYEEENVATYDMIILGMMLKHRITVTEEQINHVIAILGLPANCLAQTGVLASCNSIKPCPISFVRQVMTSMAGLGMPVSDLDDSSIRRRWSDTLWLSLRLESAKYHTEG
jgi:hypothetical protein